MKLTSNFKPNRKNRDSSQVCDIRLDTEAHELEDECKVLFYLFALSSWPPVIRQSKRFETQNLVHICSVNYRGNMSILRLTLHHLLTYRSVSMHTTLLRASTSLFFLPICPSLAKTITHTHARAQQKKKQKPRRGLSPYHLICERPLSVYHNTFIDNDWPRLLLNSVKLSLRPPKPPF